MDCAVLVVGMDFAREELCKQFRSASQKEDQQAGYLSDELGGSVTRTEGVGSVDMDSQSRHVRFRDIDHDHSAE